MYPRPMSAAIWLKIFFYLNYPFGCSDGITAPVKPSQNPKSEFLIFLYSLFTSQLLMKMQTENKRIRVIFVSWLILAIKVSQSGIYISFNKPCVPPYSFIIDFDFPSVIAPDLHKITQHLHKNEHKKKRLLPHSNNLNNFDFKQTFLAYYK